MASAVFDTALEMLTKGVSPDGEPWHGGIPRIGMSFTGGKVTKVRKRQNPDGSTTFAAEWRFGYDRWSDGYYLDDFVLVRRFLDAHPGGEKALEMAFITVAEDREAKVKADVQRWFKEQTWKPFTDIVGFQEADEWEPPTLVKFGSVEFTDPPGGIFQSQTRKLKLMVVVTAAIRARQKPVVTQAPFTAMSDRELDSWIARWESEAPENFWMDGELHLSRPAAYAMYRKQWRAMSPREQVKAMTSLRTASKQASTRIGKAGDTEVFASEPESVEFAKVRLKMLRADAKGHAVDIPELKRLPGGKPGFGGSGTSFWAYKGEKYLEERMANGRGFWGTAMVLSRMADGAAARVAQRFLSASPLGEIDQAIELLTELADNLEASTGVFLDHYRTATYWSYKSPAKIDPKIVSQFDTLDKARKGLDAARKAQEAIALAQKYDPTAKPTLRMIQDVETLIKRFTKLHADAHKVIAIASKKLVPVRLKKIAANVAAALKARMRNPSSVEIVHWQTNSFVTFHSNTADTPTMEGLEYQVVFIFTIPKEERLRNEDISGVWRPQLILAEHTASTKVGPYFRLSSGGSRDNSPITSTKQVVDAVIDYTRDWKNWKGAEEEAAGRAPLAKQIANALASALKRAGGGWGHDLGRGVEISGDNRSVSGEYRSDLPKEGAYDVGESDYHDLVDREIADWHKILDPALAPFKDRIRRVNVSAGEKSWIYTSIELR